MSLIAGSAGSGGEQSDRILDLDPEADTDRLRYFDVTGLIDPDPNVKNVSGCRFWWRGKRSDLVST